MDPLQRDALRQKHTTLVNEINSVDSLCDFLYEAKVFTQDMCDEILAEKTRKFKVQKLLDVLKRRGPTAFGYFCDGLKHIEQPWLANTLLATDQHLRTAQPKQRQNGPTPVESSYNSLLYNTPMQESHSVPSHSFPSFHQPMQCNVLETTSQFASSKMTENQPQEHVSYDHVPNKTGNAFNEHYRGFVNNPVITQYHVASGSADPSNVKFANAAVPDVRTSSPELSTHMNLQQSSSFQNYSAKATGNNDTDRDLIISNQSNMLKQGFHGGNGQMCNISNAPQSPNTVVLNTPVPNNFISTMSTETESNTSDMATMQSMQNMSSMTEIKMVDTEGHHNQNVMLSSDRNLSGDHNALLKLMSSFQDNGASPPKRQNEPDHYPIHSKPAGYALILNNRKFNCDLEERKGTDLDANSLRSLFGYLGYAVDQRDELTAQDLYNSVQEFSQYPGHAQVDSCILTILTHGIDGSLYGTDGGLVPLHYLLDMFSTTKAPHLAGKPKMLIIQACRGEKRESLVVDGTDSKRITPDLLSRFQHIEITERAQLQKSLPGKSDMIVAYATVPGYVAWRCEEKGSWFIQALCQVFRQYAFSEHAVDMLTKVNNQVATAYGTDFTQIPNQDCTLRRKWYFPPYWELSS